MKNLFIMLTLTFPLLGTAATNALLKELVHHGPIHLNEKLSSNSQDCPRQLNFRQSRPEINDGNLIVEAEGKDLIIIDRGNLINGQEKKTPYYDYGDNTNNSSFQELFGDETSFRISLTEVKRRVFLAAGISKVSQHKQTVEVQKVNEDLQVKLTTETLKTTKSSACTYN